MKHCTTDKCPQILDSSCVFYEGASLIFSGINTNDSVETVIQKLNLKLESFPVFNSNNYYNKTESDSKYKPIGYVPTWNSITGKPIFFSGNYNDLTNKPTLFNGTWASLSGKPTTIAGYGITDAFDGNYDSLSNKPTSFPPSIHTHEISDINNLQGSLENKLDKPTSDGTYLVKKTGGIISYETFSRVDLSNYYTKTETYSQTEINNFLSGKQNSIGYTPENVSNRSDSYTASSSTTYASTRALVDGLATKLDKGSYPGNASDLKNEIETKQKKLSSFDESVLIETDGNIEGNVSLFTEYFNQQVCELNFIPIQIIGIYQDGIKLLPEEFSITLPKTITIITYSTEKIEIQYIHLKNN